MARAKCLDVSWYLNGKKRPFAYSTIAESDMIEDLAKEYGGGYIEAIPDSALDNIMYEGIIKTIVTGIKQDYLKYKSSKNKKKSYIPFNFLKPNEYIKSWFQLVPDDDLRNNYKYYFYILRGIKYNKETNTYQELTDKQLEDYELKKAYVKITDAIKLYRNDCIIKLKEHNDKVIENNLRELDELINN